MCDVFLMVKLEFMVWGRKITEEYTNFITSSPGYTPSAWVITPHDDDLDQPARAVLVRFPHCEVTLPLLPHCFHITLFESKSLSLPIFKACHVKIYLPKRVISTIKYLEFFCTGDLPRLPIYLFIQSFICISMDGIMDIYLF